MKEIIVEIKNEQGIHVRPATQIANIVQKYKIPLEIQKVEGSEIVDGKNVFGVMTLAVEKGEKLRLRSILQSNDEKELQNEEKLLQELKNLIENDKFFEK